MCHCMMIRTQCDSVRDRMVAALRSWQNMMRVHCNGESAQTTFPLVSCQYFVLKLSVESASFLPDGAASSVATINGTVMLLVTSRHKPFAKKSLSTLRTFYRHVPPFRITGARVGFVPALERTEFLWGSSSSTCSSKVRQKFSFAHKTSLLRQTIFYGPVRIVPAYVQTAYANRINSWSFFATSAFAQD